LEVSTEAKELIVRSLEQSQRYLTKVLDGLTQQEQLQAWPVPKLEVLRGYANSVRQKTLALLNSSPREQLSEVPQSDRFPGSIGSILCFMSTEIALHVGQITYLRGGQRGLDK